MASFPGGNSTKGKAKLLGVSNRHNSYMRKVLIHRARAAVLRIIFSALVHAAIMLATGL
jgi:hypothetical protein